MFPDFQVLKVGALQYGAKIMRLPRPPADLSARPADFARGNARTHARTLYECSTTYVILISFIFNEL